VTALSFYTRRPHREQADLDLAGDGDALALHGRLQDVAFLDGGTLPSKPDEIRRRAGVSVALWKSWPGKVERKWPVGADGTSRVNADLAEELGRVQSLLAARSAGGKKGNKNRWKKGKRIPDGSETDSATDHSATESDHLAITDCRDMKGLEGIRLEGNRKEREGARTLSVSSPPSVEDVRKEIAAKGYTFNPERFVAVNEAKGWKDITDWRAAARAWQAIERKAPEPPPTRSGNPHVNSLAPEELDRVFGRKPRGASMTETTGAAIDPVPE
jgi:hypothetical protein